MENTVGADHWVIHPPSCGYPPGIISTDNDTMDTFLCSCCNDILRDPVQNECGHRYCRGCLEANDGKPCYIGPEESDDEECMLSIHTCRPDLAIRRDLARLQTKCVNIGCEWSGRFSGYIVHERICERPQIITHDDRNTPDSDVSPDETNIEDDSSFIVPPEEHNPDGTLLWKISDYHSKSEAAKQGAARCVESPHFYSSGAARYKMSAVLYPNGDGMMKGRSVSLFVRIWKGEDDARLVWPFNRKITFTLLNLRNEHNHKHAVIRPDPTSTSFKLPSEEKNVPTGIPDFCCIKELHDNKNGYMGHNTVYIRIQVDDKPMSEVSQETPGNN